MLALKRKEMEETIEVDTEGMVGKASSLDSVPTDAYISYYDQSNQMVRIASGY